jgi:hypothetical protein
VPNNTYVSMTVERVAKQHLDCEEARPEVRDALLADESFVQRDRSNQRRTICEPRRGALLRRYSVRRHARQSADRRSAASMKSETRSEDPNSIL